MDIGRKKGGGGGQTSQKRVNKAVVIGVAKMKFSQWSVTG